MFEWLKKRKIKKIVGSAKTYLEANYKETPKSNNDSGVKYSRRPDVRYSITVTPDKIPEAKHQEPSVQYQQWEEPDTALESKPAKDDGVKFSSRDSGVKFSLRDNYDSDTIRMAMQNLSAVGSAQRTLKTLDKSTDISFVDKMLELINEKHLRDSDVYKAAQIDRRLFSKIVSDSTYKPAKDTCIALCLAMKLTLSETNDLLSRAGYTFSHSSKRDVVLEYFFREQVYNLSDVNEVLFRLEQKILGR